MTTKQAIEILARQHDKIDDPSFPNDHTWTIQTTTYIKQFFGENSTQYLFISNFVFGAWHPRNEEHKQQQIREHPKHAKQFLKDCIETLKDTGLFKPATSNFLQRLDNSTIVTIITFSIPALIGAGFFFGNLKYDKDKLNLEQHIQVLQDSLRTFYINPNNNSKIKKNNVLLPPNARINEDNSNLKSSNNDNI